MIQLPPEKQIREDLHKIFATTDSPLPSGNLIEILMTYTSDLAKKAATRVVEEYHEIGKKGQPQRDIPDTNEIEMFMHCSMCMHEKPKGISPKDFCRINAGWTKLGFQVWCVRHDCNIAHVDFQGMQHPAVLTARIKEKPQG